MAASGKSTSSSIIALKQCYVHVRSVKDVALKNFTDIRWNTFKKSIQSWLPLEGVCRDVANTYKHCLDITFDNIPVDSAYHSTCYNRFTDIKAIEKASRRFAREAEKRVAGEPSHSEAPPSTSEPTPSPTKKLCSSFGLPVQSCGPVLPALCIICKKEQKYITKTGKRHKVSLSKAETLTAGRLQKAAEVKEDQSILSHIQDKDCVALEVQYHRCCYLRYTRFLSKPPTTVTERVEPLYESSYQMFCERIIRQRLLINQEVLRMNQLRKTFIELVKSNEGLDASNDGPNALKTRLRLDFPQLVFHAPTERNISELVYAEVMSADRLVEMLPIHSGTETTESSQTDSKPDHAQQPSEGLRMPDNLRTLYSAALFLKGLLGDSPGMTCPWPPTSEDLNVTEAQTVVPPELFNLVSWIVGATEEPTLDNYVNVTEDLNLKVLSVCQDIVYLASRGHKQTPKSPH